VEWDSALKFGAENSEKEKNRKTAGYLNYMA
jgi:hypothetical protein